MVSRGLFVEILLDYCKVSDCELAFCACWDAWAMQGCLGCARIFFIARIPVPCRDTCVVQGHLCCAKIPVLCKNKRAVQRNLSACKDSHAMQGLLYTARMPVVCKDTHAAQEVPCCARILVMGKDTCVESRCMFCSMTLLLCITTTCTIRRFLFIGPCLQSDT